MNKKYFYIVGIKGSGCAAIAELLLSLGHKVSGSDISEKFYTDAILQELKIPYHENFDKSHITSDIDQIIYSAAYSSASNVELAEAEKIGITCVVYPKALGEISLSFHKSAAIAGVHGKTTTTALAGTLVKYLGLPMSVLVGSGVSVFDGKSTFSAGDKAFIAETCEYKRHFLNFTPSHLILTSIEMDHQDYFTDYDDIRSAFKELILKLPLGGTLIYCADDKGALELATSIKNERSDLIFIPYGFNASGDYKIEKIYSQGEKLYFKIAKYNQEITLNVAGHHNALNATAVIALICSLANTNFDYDKINSALLMFKGSRRRAEIIGKTHNDILIMDDYAHHPSAIKTTIAGFKEFYPNRRMVVSFMSHTYSRTYALLDDFAKSLDGADVLLLHKIFASAREKFDGTISGMTLFDKCSNLRGDIYYFDEPTQSVSFLKDFLKAGDLFITMGAGDNFIIGQILIKEIGE